MTSRFTNGIDDHISDIIAEIQGLSCTNCGADLTEARERDDEICPECDEVLDDMYFAPLGIDTVRVHTVWITIGGPTAYLELTEENHEFTKVEFFSSYDYNNKGSFNMHSRTLSDGDFDTVAEECGYLLENFDQHV